MNQPTTIDFDKADGMTSTQVQYLNSFIEIIDMWASCFSGHYFDSNTTGKWGADSIEICQVPKCAKSSTIHKVVDSRVQMKVYPYNFFFRDNQEGEEVTVVDQLHIIGTFVI